MAAESYTLAASSTVLNVSSHTRTRIQNEGKEKVWLEAKEEGAPFDISVEEVGTIVGIKKGEERVLRLDSIAGMVGQRRRCCGQPRAAAAANGSTVVEAGAEESRRLRLKRRRELSFDTLEVAEAGMEEVELVMHPDMDLGMYGSRYGNGPGGGSAGGYGKPLVMGVGNGSCYGEGAGAVNARGYGKSGVGDGVGEKIL
ncbi:hypothetical protein GW17_00056975 [Ensete ventricosum]|nr:hypothetical protein GW17_00056975 [Ensete ventricosum]